MTAKARQSFSVVMVDDDTEYGSRLERHCRGASVSFRPPKLITPEWATSLDAADLVVWVWSKLSAPDHRQIVCRAQSQHPGLPMLFLGVALDEEESEEIVAEPASDFVRQPVDPEEFVRRADRLLRARERALAHTGKAGALEARGSAVQAKSVDLYNPRSGRLDAQRVSAFFGLSLRRLASHLGRKPQTVSKTPDAVRLQPGLAVFARIAAGLLALVGSEEGARVWMNAPNAQFGGSTPLELLLAGEGEVVVDALENMLAGQPS